MKKMIAGLIALTTAFCSMTACSKSMENENSSTGKEKAAEQVTTEAATDEETTAAEEETTSAEVPDTKGYEAVLKEFIDAYNAEDYKKTFKLTMPEGADKVLKTTVKSPSLQEEYGGITEDEMIKDSQSGLFMGKKEGNFILGDIKKAEPLSESEEYGLKSDISMIAWCVDYIDNNGGVDGVDAEEMVNGVIDLCYDDLVSEVELTEAYYLTFELEYEPTGEKNDGYAIVYRVKGGDWKVSADNFVGTDMRGKDRRLATMANSIYKAAMTVMVELDERGELTFAHDAFIVGSDNSRNFNLPGDFDVDNFRSMLSNYFEYESYNREWFVEIQDGLAKAVAVCDPDSPRNVGTYPSAEYEGSEFEGMTYDEIYDKCCKDIG